MSGTRFLGGTVRGSPSPTVFSPRLTMLERAVAKGDSVCPAVRYTRDRIGYF